MTRSSRLFFRRPLPLLLALLAPLAGIAPAHAGGNVTALDLTGFEPGPVPGTILVRLAPRLWDTRCIPVPYTLNGSLDPVPNPQGEDFLSLEEAAAGFRDAFDAWNEIPTSFIDMQLDATTSNPDPPGFDMINEVTFRTFPGAGFIASSPSVTLSADSFLPAGADLDLDGDADVAGGIATCGDVDGDGDFELPEGFYRAGTILDNDVSFNADLIRFTVDPAAVDINFLSSDLVGVAVHEFGHSHGLAHTLINQLSPEDGTGATMYPFSDLSDPDNELAERTLETDDIGYSSLLYPEGTAASGPAALGPGDVAFDEVFGILEGEVRHGVRGEPVAGASVSAVDQRTGEVVSAVFSGTTRFLLDLATGQLLIFNADINIVDGRYRLPVPMGEYRVAVEAIDGLPVGAGSVSFEAVTGSVLGQLDFPEELYDGELEGAVEERPGHGQVLPVQPGQVVGGIDLVTNRSAEVAGFDSPFPLISLFGRGLYLAAEIPAERIQAADTGEDLLIHSANFFTHVADASVVPRFDDALVTTGVVADDGTAALDLASPLAKAATLTGQEADFAPLYFEDPFALGARVRQALARQGLERLFVVLRVPEGPFPGASGLPPALFATLSNRPDGRLFLSVDGATFLPIHGFEMVFSLSVSDSPRP